MDALKIIDLSYKIAEKQILKEVNLTLPSTGIFYFTGPNGGGKSTLLKLIAGLLKPNSGKIVTPEASSISLMSALGNFGTELPLNGSGILSLYGISISKNLLAQKLIKKWHLEAILEQQISSLSSGELQKIILCAHLSREKKMILLDEPLSHIAPEASKVIWETLFEHSKKQLVIMVTHQTHLIQEFSGPEYCVHQILHQVNQLHEISLK